MHIFIRIDDLRVSDEEKTTIEYYAKLQGASIVCCFKRGFFEKSEDIFDLKVIEEYEATQNNKTYTHSEVGEMLGLE